MNIPTTEMWCISKKNTKYPIYANERNPPVGITFQTFSAPQDGRSEDLAENPPGGLLARGSIPLQYFVDFKKPERKH